jgi:phenylacetate-CoA ligase
MNSAIGRLICKSACAIGARDVIRAGREMRRVTTLPESEIQRLQIQKLNRLLARFQDVPFYQAMLADAEVPEGGIDSVSDLPIISKHEITRNLAQLASRPDAYRSSATSGSTGVNFRFFQSRTMANARTAAVRLSLGSVGIEMWGDSSVSIWGDISRGDWKNKFVKKTKLVLLNSDVWQGVGMDDRLAIDYLRRLVKVRPRLLMGYPSYLRRMAQVGRDAKVVTHAPTAIICSGETLLDTDRALIEGYFQAPLYNRYGSTEFGIIAQQCRRRGAMHIPPTRFIIERGDDGELLITDLDNSATPFVRYAIGDAGTVAWGRCDCGHHGANLVALEGRLHDEIRTPSGRMLPGQFWTIVSKTVAGVEELQLVQRSLSRLELRVKVNDEWRDEFARVLQAKVREAVGEDVSLDVVRVEEIERTAAGKRRFIISDMGEDSR